MYGCKEICGESQGEIMSIRVWRDGISLALTGIFSQMAMKKVTVAMTDEMVRDLEKERKNRRLASVAEAARVIIGDYLANKPQKAD